MTHLLNVYLIHNHTAHGAMTYLSFPLPLHALTNAWKGYSSVIPPLAKSSIICICQSWSFTLPEETSSSRNRSSSTGSSKSNPSGCVTFDSSGLNALNSSLIASFTDALSASELGLALGEDVF